MNLTRQPGRYRWLSMLVIVMASIAVLTVLVGLSILEDRLIAQAGRELQIAAAEIAEKLDLLLFERYGDIQVLGETSNWLGQDGDSWTEHLHVVQRAYPLYFWMGLIDNNGRVLAATDHATIGLDVGRTDWFRDLAGKPAIRVHDVQHDDLSKGENVVGFSTPVGSRRSAERAARFHGAIVARVATSKLEALVTRVLRELEAKAEYKQGLEYHILTRQGHVILESNPEQNGSMDLIALGVESARLAVSGETGFTQEEHRRRHVPVLTGYAQMPAREELNALGWGILVRMDREAVMAPVRSALWSAMIWGGTFFIPLLGVLLWATSRLQEERHQAETAKQAMTEAHDFLQSSLDALTSHVAILDERATIITVNRAWRLFGDQNQLRDPNHGIGRNYVDICESWTGEGAEEARRVAEGIRAVLQGQQTEWAIEYPCHGPDERRWFLVRISKFEIGAKPRVVVDHQNVTESRLVCQALQESQATTQAIIRNALDAHILMNQEGVIVGWNPKAEGIFGWSFHEAVGKLLASLIIPPGYREGHERGLRKFLAGGTGPMLGKRFEVEGWHKEGRSFPVELAITAIKRPGGYVFSTFVRDVTERVQQERRLAAEHRIAELLLGAASLDAVSQDIMMTICSLLGWRLGVLWRVDGDMQLLRCAAIQENPRGCFESFVERTRQANFAIGVGLPGRVWKSEKVEWIQDVTKDLNFPRAPFALEAGLHAAFAFPIRLDGTVYAVMEFFAEDIRSPDQKLLDMFNGIAVQLSQFLGRKAAEQNLSRSEARLAAILRLAQDAIVSVDESQRIILFNQGAEEIFGYRAEEVLGQPLDLLLPDRFQRSHGHSVHEFGASSRIAERATNRNEIFGRRKSGEEFSAEASIAKVTVEGKIIYTAILRDVSQRKREEQNLRDAKALTEQAVSEKVALLATVEAFFIRITETSTICEWTSQAEKLFGIPLVDAMGRTFQELPIDWSWEAIQEAIKQATQTISPIHLDKVRLVTHESRQRFLKLTVSPLCKDSGIDVVLMGEDITDHLLLEHDLAQAQKLESIGQLAAGIAHEINTPTQFVGDNVRFLSDSFTDIYAVLKRYRELILAVKSEHCPPELIETCETESQQADLDYLTEEIPKAIAQSYEGVERIAKIVRAMKEFAHPGSDEKTYVDLNKAIESTATVARNEWKYVADLTTDLAPDLPLVPCLLGQFNQVILNMIVNAAHAIGDVVKSTGQKGVISITSGRVGEYAEVRIMDNGTGIPEGIRHKIFDPFFTTKGVGKGTGQGLAIARSVVVDKHHGSITVEGQVGRGTTFIVRLPLNGSGEMGETEQAA